MFSVLTETVAIAYISPLLGGLILLSMMLILAGGIARGMGFTGWGKVFFLGGIIGGALAFTLHSFGG